MGAGNCALTSNFDSKFFPILCVMEEYLGLQSDENRGRGVDGFGDSRQIGHPMKGHRGGKEVERGGVACMDRRHEI